MKKSCNSFLYILFAWLICPLISAFAGNATWIVKNGEPNAEIVISANPARMSKLAAAELRDFIERISGAKLSIVSKPSDANSIKVYVGRSDYTDKLGLKVSDLKYDAFVIRSGKNWLALLGHDADYIPPKLYNHSRGKKNRKEFFAKSDAVTMEKWYNYYTTLYRNHSKSMNLWAMDDRGTPNAVYQFLRTLGCEWYFPGDIGEVVPRLKNIQLPKINKTYRPDFQVRSLYQYYQDFFMAKKSEILWQLRLGLNSGSELLGNGPRGHGITSVITRKEVAKEHPEYYAIWGGKRMTERGGKPCLSSKGLFVEHLKYLRFMFDTYGDAAISVAPSDGYGRLCECAKCAGKGTPERGRTGLLSDYVWEYVNKVAKELYKTHPDKMLTCLAYTTYLQTPKKIKMMNPNVAVVFCRWRTNLLDPGKRAEFWKLTDDWLKILPSKELFIWDYYLHARKAGPWQGVPVYFPHLISADLKFLKGKSKGEFIEVQRMWPAWKIKWRALAANHLNLFTTARLYWDADQNMDDFLGEYYVKFYGPAAKEMRKFVEFSEKNWRSINKDEKLIDKLFEFLDNAVEKTKPDTLYRKRVDLLVAFTKPLKQKLRQLSVKRVGVPEGYAYTFGKRKEDIIIDGKIDDPFWKLGNTYTFREIETGRNPAHRTTMRVSWLGNTLYFAIKCNDFDMKRITTPRAKATMSLSKKTATSGAADSLRSPSANIFDTLTAKGDYIEFLFETQSHSFYRILVSPDGKVLEADNKNGKDEWRWCSGAKIATFAGDGFWSVEAAIPVAGDGQEEIDPLNGISGRRPTKMYPWYFNVCRRRVGTNGVEKTAFSPTGKKTFLVPLKFGLLRSTR